MKHRPTLYIGLGGTGCQTLVHIQKIFTDEYGKGNIPGHIRFVGIDTDPFPEQQLLETFIHIRPGFTSPREYYGMQKEMNTGKCDWYPNKTNLLPGQTNGVASNRSNARFLLEMDSFKVMDVLRNRVANILNQCTYPQSGKGVDVRFIISLAGGTGSGMLIPLAVMLSHYEGVNIYGYSILHGIFKKYDIAGRVITNAFMNCYATTLELDYIQHASVLNPFDIKICDIDFSITEPIFKEFYMVENTDRHERLANETNELHKMLSLSMYSASLAGKGSSSFHEHINFGSFNVKNKIGWLCSLSGAEITYNGETAARLQSYYDSRKMIAELLEDRSENSEAFHAMMLSGLYGIQDTEYWNHLKSKLGIPENAEEQLFRFSSTNLDTIKEETQIAWETYDFSDIPCDIDLRINSNLCLSGQEKQLANLQAELPSVMSEIQNQKESIQITLRMVLEHIEKNATLTKWDKFISHFFPIDYKIIVRENLVKKAISLQQEIALREYVIHKIEQILTDITESKHKYQMLRVQLQSADQLLEKHINDMLDKFKNDRSPITYDISYEYWKSKQALAEEASIPGDLSRRLIECHGADSAEYIDLLLKATDNRPLIQHLRDITIEDAIESLPEMYRSHIIGFLSRAANRMLALDYRGVIPPSELIEKGILTVYSNKPTPSLTDDLLRIFRHNTTAYIDHSSSEGLKDRIILSYYCGAVLPYFIEAFSPDMVDTHYTKALDKEIYNPHIDVKLYEVLRTTNYTLKPNIPDHIYSSPIIDTPKPAPVQTPIPEAIQETIPESGKKKYNVFISSKSDDYKYAEDIYDFLVGQGLSVFLACRELKRIGEAEYALSIDEALDNTEHMIVMVSSIDHLHSKWVRYEWSTFSNDKKSGYREGNLLVIKFPEVDQKELPASLRHNETFFFDSYKNSLLYYLK